MYAPSELITGKFVHSAEFLRLALNPGGGSGGTCFGDSGGPDLLGGTNVVLGVNSYVTNANCAGVGYSSRIDIPEVLEWIEDFFALNLSIDGASGKAGEKEGGTFPKVYHRLREVSLYFSKVGKTTSDVKSTF